MRNLLLAVILVGLIPWATARAAVVDPEVVADRTEIAVEVGSIFVVNYSVLAGTDASGNRFCPTDASHPITLTISTAATLGAYPQSFLVTACDTPYPVSVTASAIGVATIQVTASGGYAGFYSTVRAGGVAYVHSHDDADPPKISVPLVPLEAEAISPLGAQVYADVKTTDLQTTPPQATCSPTGPWYPLGWTQVNCSAVDSNGNLGKASYWVHVYDRTPPALASPGDLVVWPNEYPDVFYGVTAWDVVWERTAVLCDPPSGTRFPAGTTTVRCTSTDGSGNTGYANFTVTVHDLVNPRVIAADVVAEATGPGGANVAFVATPFDFVDPDPTMSCTHASGSLFPLGTTLVTCTARDASGNVASRTFKVTVVDTTPPVITIPVTVTRDAEGPHGATVAWSSSAVDLVAGPRSVSCTPSSGSIFPVGTTRVNCTAVDTYGNRAWRELDVVVRDTAPPILLLPASVTLEATSPAGATFLYTVTATDSGAPVAATCSPAPGTFPLGVTTVACTARDSLGNLATGTFTVTVVDTTPPALQLPAGITVTTTANGATVGYPSGATDIVDLAPLTSCVPPPGDFPVGDTIVTCTSRDFSGNVANATFTVRVLQLLPPTIAVPPATTIEATGPAGATATFAATAWDPNTDAPLAPTCAPPSGSVFPLGTTIVTCSATNAAGLTATASFTVTVVDTTPPALTVPAGIALTTTGTSATVSYASAATDIVDLAPTTSCAPPPGDFPVGDTIVTCTSRDFSGNVATATFTVRVVRLLPPTIAVPAPLTREATGPGGATASFAATAWDPNTGAAIAPTCSPPSGSLFSLGTTVVACSATNAAGLTATASFTVTVVDTTPPALTVPAPLTTTATNGVNATVAYATSAFDLVSLAVAPVCTPPPGAFPLGTTAVVCKATDAAGNAATRTFTVTVLAPTPPCTVDGWKPPMDTPGHNKTGLNSFKLGSTVPLKIVLSCQGAAFTGTPRLYYQPIRLDGTPLGPEAAGTSLSHAYTANAFNGNGNHWQYDWDTRGLPAGVYRLRVDLGDGHLNTKDLDLRER